MVELGSKIFIREERFECISRNNNIVVLKKVAKELPKIKVADDLAKLSDITVDDLVKFREFYKNAYGFVGKGMLMYIGENYIGLSMKELSKAFETAMSNARTLITRIDNSSKSVETTHKILLSLLKWKSKN